MRAFPREKEQAFHGYFYGNARKAVQIVTAFLAVLCLLYAGRDYLDTHSLLLTGTNGAPALLMAALFLLTFRDGYGRVWEYIATLGGWCAAAISLGGLAHFTGGEASDHLTLTAYPTGRVLFFTLQTCLLMIAFAALRLPFRNAVTLQTGVLGASLWAFSTWILSHASDSSIAANATSRLLQPTLLVLFTVLLAAYVQERLVRSAFVAKNTLEQQALDLNAANQGLDQQARELSAANARMERDMEAAATVQRALLPAHLPDDARVCFDWAFHPCDTLGGDLLNIFSLGPDYVGLYLLDVTGHGVAASLLSVAASHFLSPDGGAGIQKLLSDVPNGGRAETGGSREGPRPIPPATVMEKLNAQFTSASALKSGRFITIFYGVLHLPTRTLRYVNAGHPSPLILSENQPPRWLESGGLPVGILENAEYEEQAVVLRPGDRFYLYSDGVIEARNAHREQFGEARMQALLESCRANRKASELGLNLLCAALADWAGAKASAQDDVSLVAFQIADR